MDEIEKLLSEDDSDEGKDLKTAEDTASDQSAEKKPNDDKSAKENAVLKRELARRQKEIDELKKGRTEAGTEATQADPEANTLKTQEDWLKEIDKRAEKKADEKFSKLRESNLRKARDRFIDSHPEYAGETGKEKLRSVLERANLFGLTSKMDEGEMMECLLDAWAVENRKELEKAANDKQKSRERAQKVATMAASAGGGSEKVDEEFTEEEREHASKFGMTPERYRKAQERLADALTTL